MKMFLIKSIICSIINSYVWINTIDKRYQLYFLSFFTFQLESILFKLTKIIHHLSEIRHQIHIKTEAIYENSQLNGFLRETLTLTMKLNLFVIFYKNYIWNVGKCIQITSILVLPCPTHSSDNQVCLCSKL